LDARIGSNLGTIEADPIRLNEVLANLVSNALRHTPPGGSIVVSADRDASGIAFTVADTGAGITEDELPHVFDRFAKSADSRGTGLGLPIAKAIVEAHGGAIEIRSEPGKGTTVRLGVPMSA
jgi:two-component system sensor histidine kinase BaeS